MYIRRDKSNLHFGPPRRRGPSIWSVLFLLLILGVIAGIIWQFDRIQGEVLTMMGEAPTATPPAAYVASEGLVAYANGELDDALVKYEEALRMNATNLDYLYEYTHTLLLLSEGTAGLEAAERMIDLDPDDPRGYALKIYALYQLDRLDEGVALGLTTLDSFPDYAPTYAYLAWTYADIGRWLQAVEMGETAISLDPNSVDGYRAYAYALTWIGSREEAIKALEIAIELHPTLDFLYFEAAEKYRALENVPAAIAAYERALAIKPTNTRALLRLCQTYLYLREDARAEEYCQQAIDIDVEYAAAWQQIGQVYYAQSKFQQSIDAYEQCVALGSESIYCWYQRGLAYIYLDQCDVAVPLLQASMDRTESDRILGHVREGLRMCQQEPPTPVPEDGSTPDGTPEDGETETNDGAGDAADS